MKTRKQGLLLAALTVLAGGGHGQTLIDLRTQTKSVDFSSASSTKPFKTGATLPATCGIGDTFFKTDAQPGKNHYGCTSPNVWTMQGGNGQPDIVLASSTCATVGGGKYVFDVGQSKTVFTVDTPASLCITGGGTVETMHVSLIFNNGSPRLVGDGAANTYSFSSGGGACGGFGTCVITTTGTWPIDFYIPIATLITTANGQFSQSPADLVDYRQALPAKIQRSGVGITGAETGTTAVDPATVPFYTTGASLPNFCAQGAQQFYLLKDAAHSIYQIYTCSNGSYVPVNYLMGTAAHRPTNCSAQQVYLASDTGTLSYASSSGSPCEWSNLAGSGTVTASSGALATHQVVLGNGGTDIRTLAPGGAGQVLQSNGAGADPTWGNGAGSVTSVGLAGDGTVFNASVPGSPVTTIGTLAPTLATQAKNTALRGPASGSNAAPTFRGAVLADLPSITSQHVFGSDSTGKPADIAPQALLASDGANLNWNPLDTRYVWFVDDFLSGSTTSGQIGQMGWSAGGTAGGTTAYVGGAWPNAGIVKLTTNGTTAGDYWTLTAAAGGPNSFGSLGASTNWDLKFILALGATTNIRIFAGFTNVCAYNPANGFGIRYDTTQNDTSYTPEVVISGVASTTTANFATANTSYHTFRVRSLVSGVLRMSMDGGAESTFCSSGCTVTVTPPANNVQPCFAVASGTVNGATLLNIDYAGFLAKVSSAASGERQ